MTRVYDDFPEGWVVVHASELRLACCDCGLTHVVRIRKRGNRYEMLLERDDRATALLRRHHAHECEPRQVRRPRKATRAAKTD